MLKPFTIAVCGLLAAPLLLQPVSGARFEPTTSSQLAAGLSSCQGAGAVGYDLRITASNTFGCANNASVPNVAYAAYSPTISANSGSFTTLGTLTGRWQKTGKRVDLSITIPITTNGTAAGNIVATLPVQAASAAVLAGRENNVTGKGLTGSITANGTTVTIQNYDNSYPGGSGYSILLSGSYEAL